MLVLICIITATSLRYPVPDGEISIQDIDVYVVADSVYGHARWHADRRSQEFAETRMDVHADLNPLFTWNTKQVFFSVIARYQAPGRPDNDVVLHDRIVTRDYPFVVLEDAKSKYGFREVSKTFR